MNRNLETRCIAYIVHLQLTWVSVTFKLLARSILSLLLKYFFVSNCFSNSNICFPVNVVLAFFFFLSPSSMSPISKLEDIRRGEEDCELEEGDCRLLSCGTVSTSLEAKRGASRVALIQWILTGSNSEVGGGAERFLLFGAPGNTWIF